MGLSPDLGDARRRLPDGCGAAGHSRCSSAGARSSRARRGKLLAVLYFACLGAGYILVEVGLIAHFVMALGNPTISASVLITGILVFSGLGALVSERILPRMRVVMPAIFLMIGGLLLLYALAIDHVLDDIGALPYFARLLCCFVLIAPPAFLMGFPMPTAMTTLGRLGKDHLFIWAWGVNGCFSVVGAAAAPVIATNFGLAAVIEIAAVAYLLALPAFFGVIAEDHGDNGERCAKCAAVRTTSKPGGIRQPRCNMTVAQRETVARRRRGHKYFIIANVLLSKGGPTVDRRPSATFSKRFCWLNFSAATLRHSVGRLQSWA